jgi:hypothetical protein
VFNPTGLLFNPTGLVTSERSKETKHGPFYSPIGLSFLPFATSCFGHLGLTVLLLGFLLLLLLWNWNAMVNGSAAQGENPMYPL